MSDGLKDPDNTPEQPVEEAPVEEVVEGSTVVEVSKATAAANRAARTFVQGLGYDVLVAILFVVVPIVATSKGWSDFDLKLLGFLLAKSVVMAAAAYVMKYLGITLPGTNQQ